MAQKILLVEGNDDEHVMKHICGNRGIPQLDEVKPLCGAERLLEDLPVRLKLSSADDIVGVVIDADTDLAARWQAIRDRLSQSGYKNVPVDPDPNGTILEPPAELPRPRVGVWIMPNNKTTGILEDFLNFLVPQPDALFNHVNASVDAISDQRFTQNDKPKAVIHTWLAWQSEPGLPYGTAITARFLDPNLPEADVLVSWLRRLFES
jgi:hypothetical protein